MRSTETEPVIETEVTFRIDGEPVAWTTQYGRDGYYKPHHLSNWQDDVRLLARPHRPGEPFDGPVYLHLVFYRTPPKSWPKWRRSFARLRPAPTKPDVDNLTKAVVDALEDEGFFTDDGRIVGEIVEKRWADAEHPPGVQVRMVAMPADPKRKAEAESAPRLFAFGQWVIGPGPSGK